ncbi:papain-like cysteine protease family protein [Pedobacter sp. WC2501]|uniref:papain-like cysteine protease family protein n=1 Tax=Pedobacter sp. WC2501 TaxID=3461400 RepID=UPI0040463769
MVESITFNIDKQLKSNWCWAAAAESIARYYGKTEFQDQVQLAWRVLGKECKCAGVSCSICNIPQFIGEVLEIAGLQKKAIPEAVSKDQLIEELINQRPVIAVIKWNNSATGHLIVVSAVNCDQHFTVWDSRQPQMSILSYQDLLNNYQGKSTWVNTFFTKAD